MNHRRPPWPALGVVALVLAAGCGGGNDARTPTQPSGVASQQARDYLDHVIRLMQANSINRLTIDWTSFRTAVLAEAASAQTIADTYPAIRTALRLLGDGHSSFQTPSGSVIFVPTRSCGAPGAATPPLPPTIGYVRVGAFSGSGPAAAEFANGIQQAISAADREDLVGWIVDLRGNGGGNMWPMIAGVGPVLGEGVLGYFVDPLGAESVWEYRSGASWLDGAARQRVDRPYRLHREAPRVAVLTDNAIGSSGEATVIAFRSARTPVPSAVRRAVCRRPTARSPCPTARC